MWSEFLQSDTYSKGPGSLVSKVIDGTLERYRRTGIAGVANTGRDQNWTGHDIAQANWYAFGRLAWNPDLPPGAIADEWIRMTWGGRARRGRDDPDDPARLVRGVRPLHDAARAAPPDRRRSLRAHAGERRPAPRGLVRRSTTIAPTRTASDSIARARAATPSISTTRRCGTAGTIRRRRPRGCCSGSTGCRGTTG